MPISHPRRSTLFVGALVLDALPVALASGSDIVCIDLEDAVPAAQKDNARDAVFARLRDLTVPKGVELIARVNSLRSLDGIGDVRTALLEPGPLGALMLPKVDTADEVRWAAALVEEAKSGVDLYAIIETAQGLENCAAIARGDARLKALYFGGFDLSTALGCTMAWEPLLYARARVVHAAACAGIEALDCPFPEIDDVTGLRAECERVKALGMSGKAAKHASQVATIRDAFTPTAAEIARARRIVELFRAEPTRPLVFEGKLIELPAIKRLERVADLSGPR
jgi:(S)-citramalyl-CoA lyase